MSATPDNTTKPPPEPGPLPIPGIAALLSFAVPGLGQIVQGFLGGNPVRLAKGCLFLVAIWGMFFYGLAKSHWRNVYLPHAQEIYVLDDQRSGRVFKSAQFLGRQLPAFPGNLWHRPHYLFQFWVGLPAWPALWNYAFPDAPVFGKYLESPGTVTAGDQHNQEQVRRDHLKASEDEDNRIQMEPGMGRLWDIYWIYTVVAGALNLVVIYDAWAGPVRFRVARPKGRKGKQ